MSRPLVVLLTAIVVLALMRKTSARSSRTCDEYRRCATPFHQRVRRLRTTVRSIRSGWLRRMFRDAS